MWVVLAGPAAVLRIDSPSLRDVTEYHAPPNVGAPNALAISRDGTVWVSFVHGAWIWRIDAATHVPELVEAVAPARSPRPAAEDGQGPPRFVSVARRPLGRAR
jgi:streptogramin lyase